MKCSFCGKEVREGSTVCESCGAELTIDNNGNEDSAVQTKNNTELEMKWYKFLIYFLLYANFVTYLFDGFIYLFGDKINFLSELFADTLFTGKFRIIGIIYAVVLITLSVISLYVRNGLAKFKVSAPKNFIIFDIITSVISTVVTLLSMILVENAGLSDWLPELLGSLLGSTAIIMCNITYFRKRKHLFINR